MPAPVITSIQVQVHSCKAIYFRFTGLFGISAIFTNWIEIVLSAIDFFRGEELRGGIQGHVHIDDNLDKIGSLI